VKKGNGTDEENRARQRTVLPIMNESMWKWHVRLQRIIYLNIHCILFYGLFKQSVSISAPSIIRIIKSRRMRWAGHLARMGRRGIHIGYCWQSQKERHHYEDQYAGGWTILKWILER
jgi:hypothetical protein